MSNKELTQRDDDEGQFGPCMAALNSRRRRFVELLFVGHNGHGRISKAYLAAGFKDGGAASVSACASRLHNDPAIQAAVQELAAKALRGLAPEAVDVLKTILLDPQNKDQMKAVSKILEHAVPIEQKISVAHTHEIVDKRAEEINALKIQRDKLGASREALIATWGLSGLERIERNERAAMAQPVIEEGSFVEVEPELW
jgi:phage terminase small subunit